MEASKGLYEGFRPSDLRFGAARTLAAYIKRAQRFADKATRIEASAEQLIEGAMKTTEEGVRQFQAGRRQMGADFKVLDARLNRVVTEAGQNISHAIAQAHAVGGSYILSASEVMKGRHEELAAGANKLNLAALRLEKAAERAEANRQDALKELDQLRVYRSELDRFEHELATRIAEARRTIYKRLDWTDRLWYVFCPPRLVVDEPKKPVSPSVGLRKGSGA